MQKRFRLKKNHEIASVVKSRKRVSSLCYTVYYMKNNNNLNRYAISVGKKYGNAVERNYAKRIVREIIRPMKDVHPYANVVVVIKEHFKNKKFLELKEELTKLFNQMRDRLKVENRYD